MPQPDEALVGQGGHRAGEGATDEAGRGEHARHARKTRTGRAGHTEQRGSGRCHVQRAAGGWRRAAQALCPPPSSSRQRSAQAAAAMAAAVGCALGRVCMRHRGRLQTELQWDGAAASRRASCRGMLMPRQAAAQAGAACTPAHRRHARAKHRANAGGQASRQHDMQLTCPGASPTAGKKQGVGQGAGETGGEGGCTGARLAAAPGAMSRHSHRCLCPASLCPPHLRDSSAAVVVIRPPLIVMQLLPLRAARRGAACHGACRGWATAQQPGWVSTHAYAGTAAAARTTGLAAQQSLRACPQTGAHRSRRPRRSRPRRSRPLRPLLRRGLPPRRSQPPRRSRALLRRRRVQGSRHTPQGSRHREGTQRAHQSRGRRQSQARQTARQSRRPLREGGQHTCAASAGCRGAASMPACTRPSLPCPPPGSLWPKGSPPAVISSIIRLACG